MIDVLGETPVRILVILAIAFAAHLAVRAIRTLAERFVMPDPVGRAQIWRRRPRFATLTTIFVSALTFTIYFLAVGFVLSELGVDLTTYVASASVIGLAIGFGSQGFVQDVVVGLTLIFSDVLNVGNVVDISGQTGRVDRIGLRFTTLTNVLDQSVNIPNRNITQINRYRRGYVRAYADVQIPDGANVDDVVQTVERIALGMRQQFPAIIMADPESMGVRSTASGSWSFLRIKFKLWPGQGAMIETGYKQRLLSALKASFPDYADWMITITYRAR